MRLIPPRRPTITTIFDISLSHALPLVASRQTHGGSGNSKKTATYLAFERRRNTTIVPVRLRPGLMRGCFKHLHFLHMNLSLCPQISKCPLTLLQRIVLQSLDALSPLAGLVCFRQFIPCMLCDF